LGSFAESLGIGTNNLAAWLMAVILVQAISLVALAVLWRRTAGSARRWDGLLEGAEGLGAVEMLQRHLQTLREHEDRLARGDARVDALSSRLAHSVRRIGLVKYDAFEDVGGKQSFTLALMDDAGNGTVLTSLIGRNECRVFAKRLEGGRADVATTAEEDAAIAAAGRWD